MPHKTIDGFVSVTEVISTIHKPWLLNWYRSAVKKDGYNGWLKCDQQSQRGKEEGTMFHFAIENYLLHKMPVPQEFKPWQTWYDAGEFKPLLIEPAEPFRDENLKLQGTPDYIEDMDGTPVVWDWKYSKVYSDDYGLQLAAYTYLYWVSKGRTSEYAFAMSPFGMVGWLNKETGECKGVKFEPLEKYWRVFKGLILATHYLKKIGEWEK